MHVKQFFIEKSFETVIEWMVFSQRDAEHDVCWHRFFEHAARPTVVSVKN
jgi:hypothetical protein